MCDSPTGNVLATNKNVQKSLEVKEAVKKLIPVRRQAHIQAGPMGNNSETRNIKEMTYPGL